MNKQQFKRKPNWLVNAPSGVETAQLFLSNNNLVTVDLDGYFRIKPKSELQESAP
jgi:hypothetical protein